MKWVKNARGRTVPTEVRGQPAKAYVGVHATRPGGTKATTYISYHRPGQSKVVDSIAQVIRQCDLSDGMTVSFHHHLRNGDGVVNMVMEEIARAGLKDINILPSALFPVHEPLIDLVRNGTVGIIDGSLNGPLGRAASFGLFDEPIILRSHGGRTRAIEAGDAHVDVAFIAASEADPMGNANAVNGPSAFGPMGFPWIDAQYADKVVIVTDCLVPYPATPISIPSTHVDFVVKVASIGDPSGIQSGTTRITSSPARLLIAKYAVRVLADAGYLKDGFSFQAGAGGISLAVVRFLHDYMKAKGIVGSFAMGGITGLVVDMLRDGTIKTILDAQAFDLKAVESLRDDPRHLEVSHYMFGNPHNKGCVVHQQDACFLGATEVDLDFNVNVNTHSDGLLLHGIGGHADAAAGSEVTVIVIPLLRGRIPVIVERVTTVSTPGDSVDVVVTERGIAVNPAREDLLERLRGSDLPLMEIRDLREKALRLGAHTDPPALEDEPIAYIEYRDGTMLDTVWKVRH